MGNSETKPESTGEYALVSSSGTNKLTRHFVTLQDKILKFYSDEEKNNFTGIFDLQKFFLIDVGVRGEKKSITLIPCESQRYSLVLISKPYFTNLISEKAKNGIWKIYIKILDDETITLDVKPNDTIQNIKSKIQNIKSNIQPDKQRLVFGGKELVGSAALLDYNIQNESTLHLVIGLSILFVIYSCIINKRITNKKLSNENGINLLFFLYICIAFYLIFLALVSIYFSINPSQNQSLIVTILYYIINIIFLSLLMYKFRYYLYTYNNTKCGTDLKNMIASNEATKPQTKTQKEIHDDKLTPLTPQINYNSNIEMNKIYAKTTNKSNGEIQKDVTNTPKMDIFASSDPTYENQESSLQISQNSKKNFPSKTPGANAFKSRHNVNDSYDFNNNVR